MSTTWLDAENVSSSTCTIVLVISENSGTNAKLARRILTLAYRYTRPMISCRTWLGWLSIRSTYYVFHPCTISENREQVSRDRQGEISFRTLKS